MMFLVSFLRQSEIQSFPPTLKVVSQEGSMLESVLKQPILPMIFLNNFPDQFQNPCFQDQQNYHMSSTSTESYLKQVQSIKVEDCIKISIDMEFLNANFQLIKQCLLRVSDLENEIGQSRNQEEKTHREIFQRLNFVQKEASEQKTLISEHEQQIKVLRKSLGDDFLKKMDELEAKSKKSHDIDQLVRKLEALNKFVQQETFQQYQKKADEQIKGVNKLKQSLTNFVDHNTFKDFKDSTSSQFDTSTNTLNQLKLVHKVLQTQINTVDIKVTKASDDVKENNQMMKEINFAEMQERIRKHKDQTDTKIGDLLSKMKRKVGNGDLVELEKGLVEKIDGFLIGIHSDNASKGETRDALLFLEKRVNEIFGILTPKQEEEQDALFARKKWDCASCSRDLGKYEGRLGQFRPWAVFPARQMNPQLSGGYGYLNYIDKLAYKRGTSADDSGLQRLSKTFYNSSPNTRENNSPQKSSTRTTNFMSAYGSTAEHPTASLKEEYFKGEKQRGKSSKMFRVKRDKKEQGSLIEVGEKEKAKEIM